MRYEVAFSISLHASSAETYKEAGSYLVIFIANLRLQHIFWEAPMYQTPTAVTHLLRGSNVPNSNSSDTSSERLQYTKFQQQWHIFWEIPMCHIPTAMTHIFWEAPMYQFPTAVNLAWSQITSFREEQNQLHLYQQLAHSHQTYLWTRV